MLTVGAGLMEVSLATGLNPTQGSSSFFLEKNCPWRRLLVCFAFIPSR